MAVKVAEYLGQRTDVDSPVIQPVTRGRHDCPFMNSHCTKASRGQEPVCSVRKADGTLWITCEHRLCATKRGLRLNDHQKSVLLGVSHTVWNPGLMAGDVVFKREVELEVTDESDYAADYIMATREGRHAYPGPDRVILEMQGGGETSNTGEITKHLRDKWSRSPSNAVLREQVQGTGTLETNAWRRQQEQFIIKGNIAMTSWKGYGIVFCVGSPLYDYLKKRFEDAHLPDLRTHNWTLALVGFKEDDTEPAKPGPIPLIIDPSRLLFTNYQSFVHTLINQGRPSPEAFGGDFTSLDGDTHTLSIAGRAAPKQAILAVAENTDEKWG